MRRRHSCHNAKERTEKSLRSLGVSAYLDFQEFCWQKLFNFSQSFKQSTFMLYGVLSQEVAQGLIIKDFSFVRHRLAPVSSLSSLPNSSRILFPHVLPSSLESLGFFPSSSFHLLFFSAFKLHHQTFSSLPCPL